MTAMRDHITDQLGTKLARYGVVVWADAPGEYRGTVEELVPDDATLESFDGSWYQLRRRVEPHFSKEQPRLVLYIDRTTPADDPLAEIRAAGTEFRLRLATLLRQTMSAEIAAPKLADIEKSATTLVEAETLIEGGAAGGPATLVKALRLHEPTDILIRLATDARKLLQDRPDLRAESNAFVESQLGLGPVPDEIEGAIARHLVLVQLSESVVVFPDETEHAKPTVTAEQRRRRETVLRRW